MSVAAVDGLVPGARWGGEGQLVVLPPGPLPDGARVVAVLAVVPDPPRAPDSRTPPAVGARMGGPHRPGPVRATRLGPGAAVSGSPVGAARVGVRLGGIRVGPAVDPGPSAGVPAAGMSPAQVPSGPEQPDPPMVIGPGLLLDRGARQVLVDGEPLELTRREFDLLAHLAVRPGRVLTRRQLLTVAWDPADGRPAGPRTVDVHVARVRRKLGDRYGEAVDTVRGVGYRWVAEPKVTRQ